MSKLDQQYAEIMQKRFGIALYRPLPLSVFNSGTCGYFDDQGSWNPIAHLEKEELLVQKGLKPVQVALEKAPVDNGITWGPMVSKNVKANKVDLSGGINSVPGIPLTVSAVYSFSSDRDVGALLLTSSPVTHERFYHEEPFKNWCKNNALAILRNWPEVKKYGLWIITSTYATKKCAIHMSSAFGRGIKVGFSVDTLGLCKVGPGGDWYRSQTDEGWGEYTTEGDDKSVVFFGGLKFHYTRLMRKDLKHTSGIPVFREQPGHEEAEFVTVVPDPENEDASFVVDCEKCPGEENQEVADQDEEW